MPDSATVRTIAVLADCHIHPGAGIDWPPPALQALRGADLIITLGDMGERVGRRALEAIAPVVGVRGEDDEAESDELKAALALEHGGLRIGCVFDPVAAGLASGKAPFAPAPGAAETERRLFDGRLDVLLCASTHVASVDDVAGRLTVDPGSVTLPTGKDKGAPGTFALLTVEGGRASARIVAVG